MLTPGFDRSTLSLLCSSVSVAYWGSSKMHTLYFRMSVARTAMDSVSVNLRPRHARGPALKGMKASLGQSLKKRLGL